ncbi:hypothetical protein KX816_19285 [Sphingosinicellaceae bacterium]|nr:hypothetical protein KX816_19285 [Sphingosinicellaceae bacterium]
MPADHPGGGAARAADPLAAAWRACQRLPRCHGAALFVGGYASVVVIFTAALSGLVEMLATP